MLVRVQFSLGLISFLPLNGNDYFRASPVVVLFPETSNYVVVVVVVVSNDLPILMLIMLECVALLKRKEKFLAFMSSHFNFSLGKLTLKLKINDNN